MFSKADYVGAFDIGDNFPERNSVVFARNAMWDIARSVGVKWYLELDDDYTQFIYKYTNELVFTTKHPEVRNLDNLFSALLDFYRSISAHCIAIAQGGDFIAGPKGAFGKSIWLKRKVMNTFFCCTDRPFQWLGRMNDDVNTYLVNGNRGLIFGQIHSACMEQADTQSASGGLTELYLQRGTYVKSFYSVMFGPSYAVVYPDTNMSRLHHRINWNHAVPKIMSEQYRKRSQAQEHT